MDNDFSIELQAAMDSFSMADFLDSEGIEYRRATGTRGPQFNVKCCPLCGGSKYKVYLNEENGLGNCFHGDCEAKFNKFTFIKAHSGLTGYLLIDFIKNLSKSFGWMPKKKKVEAIAKTVELVIPESFAIPFGDKNLTYLEERGIGKGAAKYFQLRYCQTGEFYYYTPEGKVAYQTYDKRVIIPIFDLNGELVSFQGRDITGTAEKKYMFPPGFAATGAHLYNGHRVVTGAKSVCVGEGAFDVMAIKLALMADPFLRDVEAIGTFGKHLSSGESNSQLEKFVMLRARGLENVTFMWDGEEQALKDAIRAAAMIKGLGLKAYIALLPKGKDPNEVDGSVVRDAYLNATELTKTNALRLLVKNPYK